MFANDFVSFFPPSANSGGSNDICDTQFTVAPLTESPAFVVMT